MYCLNHFVEKKSDVNKRVGKKQILKKVETETQIGKFTYQQKVRLEALY